MKITLRKVKSSHKGEKYNPDFFKSIQLAPNISAISITNNIMGVGGIFYTIIRKYDLDYMQIGKACSEVDEQKKVIKVNGNNDVIIVPKTFSSSKYSITKYSNQICNEIFSKRYLHFTHFGFLKTEFPKNQIEKILAVFLIKNKINCEVCWDIDEKFFDEMKSLLKTTLQENNLSIEFETYTDENFKWSSEYKSICDEQIRTFNENSRNNNLVDLVRNQISNENIVRRNDVVTRRPNNIIQIGTVAAGNAGEFYALQIFIRMGFVAGKAPEGTSKYDLLVMSSDAYTFKPVQVKTITNGEHWILSIAHETVTENLVYCFVKFTDIQSLPKIFLIPADVVSDVIFMGNKIYMKLPNRFGRFRTGSDMRTLKIDFSTLLSSVAEPHTYLNEEEMFFIREHSLGWLDAYESNFDIFSTQVEQ